MKNILGCLISALLTLTGTAALAASTDWQEVMGGAVRLITSGPLENGTYLAGVEFMLDDGWHTYWRYPGEAGIPPQLDFSASENVGNIEVLYPAPELYDDGFSTSIVYHHGIVLPVKITPEDLNSDVSLSLSMFFGVCSDVCVPGDTTFDLRLAPDSEPDSHSMSLIERDLDRVPLSATTEAPFVRNLEVIEAEAKPALLISANLASTGGDDATLFAEGPEGSYIGVPRLTDRTGNTATWTLRLNGLAHDNGQSQLTLVLVDGDTSVESQHPVTIPQQ